MLTFDQADYPANTPLVGQRLSMRSVTTAATPDENPTYTATYTRDTLFSGVMQSRSTVTFGGALPRTPLPIPNLPGYPGDYPVPRNCTIFNNQGMGGAVSYFMVVVPALLGPRANLATPISPSNPLVPQTVSLLLAPGSMLTLSTWQITYPGSGRLPAGYAWYPPFLIAMDTPADPAPNSLDVFGAGPTVNATNPAPTASAHATVSADVIYY